MMVKRVNLNTLLMLVTVGVFGFFGKEALVTLKTNAETLTRVEANQKFVLGRLQIIEDDVKDHERRLTIAETKQR